MDQPGFSLLNPVGSINFDLPATSAIHQADEEDEAAEEERIKEKELQDLLTNAFDDLIDDEDGNDEDRSSLIDDHDSHYSDDHYYRKPNWNAQADHCKQHSGNEVSRGSISERSVKFREDKSNSLNSNSSSGNTENDRSGGSQPGEDWERRYYLDQWDGEGDYVESDMHNSNVKPLPTGHQVSSNNDHGVQVNKSTQNLGFVYNDPVDLGVPNGSESVVQYGLNGNADDVQKKFFTANGETSSTQAEMQQLRILYAARGREIERLQEELDATKDKAAKEFQILKRYLAKAKDEKEECAANLEENRNMLNAAKQTMSRLEGESRALEIQLKSMTENRDELLQRLQATESTIENLHAQFKELSKSENMVRAKEQHVIILNSIQDKHNKEKYELKVQVDELKENLANKEEVVEDTKRQMARVEREYDQTKMEKAETVNRLIKALEESQRECQRLVKAGANETLVDHDVVKSLKNQLCETRRELQLYVTAAELQIMTLKSDQQVSANEIQKSVKAQGHDGLVSALKGEVERSLACLQAKNEQLQKLQASHQSALANSTRMEEKSTFAERELQIAKRNIEELNKKLDEADVNKSGAFKEMKKRVELLDQEKSITNADLAKRDGKVRALESSKRELSQLVQQLKDELAGLSAHYEEDGRKAVQACRDACLRLHEDAIRGKQEEMLRQLQLIQEEYTLEAKKLCQELDEVKMSYVKVCEEKDEIEQRWNSEKTNEIETLTRDLENKKRIEMQALNEQLRSVTKELTNERKLQRNFDKRLSERIKELKQVWEKEQDLVIQEKVLAKVKEELHRYMSERSTVERNEGDEQVEQIHRLEERVKESEAAWKQHLTNVKVNMEEEKKKALGELSLEKDQLLQEKVEAIITEKSKEKELALVEAEVRVANELETFLAEQKERFVTALKNMQASHAKEKSDILHQCETKFSKVKEDYEKLLSSQRESQRQATDEHAVKASEEVNKLRGAIALLEERCRKNDEDKVRTVSELNKLLKSKSTELEEIKLTLERKLSFAFTREQSEALVGSLENEVAVLRASASKAEDDAADMKVRLEEEELKHKAVTAKYRLLKEKLKKYHRYIHSKEREFAGTLTKLMEGNNQTPDRISAIKAEVVHILDAKIQELQLRFLSNVSGQNVIKDNGLLPSQGSKNCVNKEADQLRKHFAESIQKIQNDVISFLEDCSQKVTKKIQAEVAAATWLMAERLDVTKSTVDTLKKEVCDGVPYGEKSSTLKPIATATATTTSSSSGCGTMAGSKSNATPQPPDSAAIFRGVTVQTSDFSSKEQAGLNKGIKPVEYWSSTPYGNEGNVQWMANNRPSLRLTASAKVRIASPLSSKLPLSPSPDSISTGTCYSNGFVSSAGSGDQAIPEKLSNAVTRHRPPVGADQEASRSLIASLAPLQPQVDDEESQLRKDLFKTFATELSLMKSAFWKSVEEAKDAKARATANLPNSLSK